MIRYVAFLRGINVSGQKIIPMVQLKEIFEEMKCTDVSTYIQSGNVIFDSPQNDVSKLAEKIETGLKVALEYDVPVVVRTMERLTELIAINRFVASPINAESKPYFTLVRSAAKREIPIPFITAKKEVAVIGVDGLDVFCLSYQLPNGSWGFPNAIIEKGFGVVATTRNPNTISKIVAKFR